MTAIHHPYVSRGRSLLRTLYLPLLFLLPLVVRAEGYASHPAYPAFEARMVSEHGFDAARLRALFSQAERKDSILEAIARPAEKRLSWGEYRALFLTDARISGGVEFWRANEPALTRAAARFGVPPEVIVAIIGVETRYGGNMGSYRVIDALATLAFDYPPRSPFFTGELEQFLVMTREQGFDPLDLTGSYAGAMGMGQFIPSSFRNFAIDFDGDQRADIWSSRADAVGSVANYFRKNGWEPGGGVVERASASGRVAEDRMNPGLEPNTPVSELAALGLRAPGDLAAGTQVLPLMLQTDAGPEYWLGLHNFYVITRYNRSPLYAMAVHELSQAILAGHGAR
jgi:membrane-bound lytic murein transglycosylase B